MKIERVETAKCLGGEGPLWDVAEQALYFIDNSGRKLHRYHPASGQTRSWDMPSTITAFALRETGDSVVTLRTGVQLFDLVRDVLEPIYPLADPPPFVFNDGKVDRRGRFLLGASTAHFDAPRPDGGLYRLNRDLSLTQLDDGIHFSNGPCWSPGNETFYFADSWLKKIYAYDYDLETGSVANRRIFADTSELGGLPDGATVDADGLVWVAVYGGGVIAAFRPDGKIERTIEMPVRMVSSVMFGGPRLDELYVTTIEHSAMGEESEPGAGELYRIEGLGVRGLPETRIGAEAG